MDTLSVAEYADIRGCTPRNIRKQITSGKLKAIETVNSRNRKVFEIPLDQLNPEEQAKFYKNKGIIKTTKEVKHSEKLEEMTALEREECAFWEK